MKSTYFSNPSLLLLISLFLLAPIFYKSNQGGGGLELPINILAWLIVSLFVFINLWQTIKRQKLVYSKHLLFCLIFPITIVFSGFGNEVPQKIDWFFRQIYILGGVLFLFALFQSNLTNPKKEVILKIVVLSVFIQSIVGIFQVYSGIEYSKWFPVHPTYPTAMGLFQQKNILASFLVTGVLILFYLISRPTFNSSGIKTRIFYLIFLALVTHVIILTGSLVGFLSLILGLLVMLLSRAKQLYKHKLFLLFAMLFSAIGLVTASASFSELNDKVGLITSEHTKSIRQTMYAISAELIIEKPLWGYGIGQFPWAWFEQTADYLARNPDGYITDKGYVSHPHNELLLWAIEGGMVSVFALLIFAFTVIKALFYLGVSRGGAYFSLLIPITFHTQVELPFYGSSLHWFLWLFIIFIIFQHITVIHRLNISNLASLYFKSAIIGMLLISCLFLIRAEIARTELDKFIRGEGGNLQYALKDPYFNAKAERILMRIHYFSSLENNDKKEMPIFIKWQEKDIKVQPNSLAFHMLSNAYSLMGDGNSQCRIAKQGLAVYTKNERLLEAVESCQN